jgi:hypothetical protein
MTADEHAQMQKLEGLVKRYRSRIVELTLGYREVLALMPPERVRLIAHDPDELLGTPSARAQRRRARKLAPRELRDIAIMGGEPSL